MKFLCLAFEEQRTLDELSAAEWRRLREETLATVDELRGSGHLLDAQPLRSAATARTVRLRQGRVVVTDGPFAEIREQLGGFFVLEAVDLDEAVRLAARWPSARLGTIEVRPLEDGLPIERRYS